MSDKVEMKSILIGPHMIIYNENATEISEIFGIDGDKTIEYLLKVTRENKDPAIIMKTILEDRNYNALIFLGLSMLFMKYIL